MEGVVDKRLALGMVVGSAEDLSEELSQELQLRGSTKTLCKHQHYTCNHTDNVKPSFYHTTQQYCCTNVMVLLLEQVEVSAVYISYLGFTLLLCCLKFCTPGGLTSLANKLVLLC